MKLIKGIRIERFRSIRDHALDQVEPFTCLIGKNSTGKSNVLRALNLFFNREVESGQPVDFQRDYHETKGGRNRKKVVSISVDFVLPETFNYRKELSSLNTLGDEFTITRTWQLDQRREPFDTLTVEVQGKTPANAEELANQFLGLIHYRYVPVRGVPSALLREESQEIADSLFLRMKGDKHASKFLESLTAAASRMLQEAASSLEDIGAPLSGPSLATAGSLGEMLRMSGFQASGPHGGTVQDEDWGAGHQAFFLYAVLYTIDTAYSRFFGWRQATIWGIEEPESTLHRDLETRLADQLREWTRDKRSRMQILQTTHSSVFAMASDVGYWVEVDDSASAMDRLAVPELVRTAETGGVSGWMQPVLSFPWNVVVLVEGPIDMEVLYHVAQIAGFDELRFLTVPNLDPKSSARGKDGIIKYLRRNSDLIRNRPNGSPLLALFDWDVSDQDLKKARSAYGTGGDDRVIRMNPEYCPDELGTDFRGIERFYPSRLVLEGHNDGDFVVGFGGPADPYSISKKQLDKAKGPLLERIRNVTDPTQLEPLIKVLVDVHRAATDTRWTQAELPIPEQDAEGG